MSVATRAISEVTGPERIPELPNASVSQPVDVLFATSSWRSAAQQGLER
jgi:hypothetical protein